MTKRYDAGEVITAMVTPFNKKLEIDYDKAGDLAKYLLKNGSDAILVSGTTGENPTLAHEEELELLSTVKRAAGKSGKVIFNSGSNCTETAIKMTKKVTKEGADALLSVVPYYNKPSQDGMIAHFSAIAESTDLPIFLYNIPSRTGVLMSVDTIKTLAKKYKNIAGIKQSCPDLDMVSEMKIACPEDFVIYSGDDSLTLPMLSVGAEGVVSVASHLWGNEIKAMIHNFKTGNYNVAKNMHLKLYPICKKIFSVPSPAPIKAALAKEGLLEDYLRLPMVALNPEQRADLYSFLDDLKKD